jgi:hypothetical protein
MFGVPVVAALVSYGLHVRMWASRLNHVPSFMYQPAQETVGDFLAHATRSLIMLALPAFGRAGNVQVGVAAALFVGALAWLASRRAPAPRVRRPAHHALRHAPAQHRGRHRGALPFRR